MIDILLLLLIVFAVPTLILVTLVWFVSKTFDKGFRSITESIEKHFNGK
jgi:hypothetical protein